MPDYCDNELSVSGPQAELVRFKEAAATSETPFDFNVFVSYPEEFRKADQEYKEWEQKDPSERSNIEPKDGFNHGGYKWCMTNWGTKWPARDIELTETEKALNYCFQTAWSPPLHVILGASRAFPALTFSLEYAVGGPIDFGSYVARNGENSAIEWSSTPKVTERGGLVFARRVL